MSAERQQILAPSGLVVTSAPPRQLQRIRDGRMSPKELKEWLVARYEVAHFFDPILQKILDGLRERHPEKLPLIGVLEGNLREEQGRGEGEYAQLSHAEARNQLLVALGLDPQSDETLGTIDAPKDLDPRAYRWVFQEMLPLIQSNPVGAAAGMGEWESRVGGEDGEWTLLLPALEAAFPHLKRRIYAPSNALWHIASHASADEDHGLAIKQGLRASCSTADIALIEEGKLTVHRAFDTFWNSPSRGRY